MAWQAEFVANCLPRAGGISRAIIRRGLASFLSGSEILTPPIIPAPGLPSCNNKAPRTSRQDGCLLPGLAWRAVPWPSDKVRLKARWAAGSSPAGVDNLAPANCCREQAAIRCMGQEFVRSMSASLPIGIRFSRYDVAWRVWPRSFLETSIGAFGGLGTSCHWLAGKRPACSQHLSAHP